MTDIKKKVADAQLAITLALRIEYEGRQSLKKKLAADTFAHQKFLDDTADAYAQAALAYMRSRGVLQPVGYDGTPMTPVPYADESGLVLTWDLGGGPAYTFLAPWDTIATEKEAA